MINNIIYIILYILNNIIKIYCDFDHSYKYNNLNENNIILQNKMSKIRVCWIIAVYRAIEKRQTIIIIRKKLKLEVEFKEKIKKAKLGACSIPTLDEYLKY